MCFSTSQVALCLSEKVRLSCVCVCVCVCVLCDLQEPVCDVVALEELRGRAVDTTLVVSLRTHARTRTHADMAHVTHADMAHMDTYTPGKQFTHDRLSTGISLSCREGQ